MGREKETEKGLRDAGSSERILGMRTSEVPPRASTTLEGYPMLSTPKDVNQTIETAVSSSEVKEPGAERRRYHTANYKLRILKEADLCRGEPGAVASLLRREGLYSSCLTTWSTQRDSGALSALSKTRGRKLKREPLVVENERLRKQMTQLEARYRQSILIIEAQKKIAEILGNPIQGDPIIELESL